VEKQGAVIKAKGLERKWYKEEKKKMGSVMFDLK